MASTTTEQSTVRLAVVGVTGYGWSLVQHILKSSAALSCRLVAAADNQMSKAPERVERLKAEGVELYDDALEMYQALSGRCEGMYVATGIHSHEPLAVAAFRAGFPLHLEKPAAATVQEVGRILEEMNRAGQFCLVGFQAVHSDEIRFIKDRVVSGRLGKVKALTCWASWPRGQAYYERNDWAGRLRAGGRWVLDGPASNALGHQVTNLLLLASAQPSRLAGLRAVRAELYAASPITGHDTAAIEMVTTEGQTAHMLVTHCGLREFGPVIEIEASRGKAVYQAKTGASITYDDGSSESCPASADSGRGAMIANFVEAIRAGNGSALRCPLSQARTMTLALNGAHESSRRIHRIPADRCRQVDEGRTGPRTVVDGLDELLASAAKQRCLLSDLPDAPPWTVATDAFPLEGYERFPQQFRDSSD